MKLVSSIREYEPHAVPSTAWILRVARNVDIDHFRQCRSATCEEVPEQLSFEGDDAGRDLRWSSSSRSGHFPTTSATLWCSGTSGA